VRKSAIIATLALSLIAVISCSETSANPGKVSNGSETSVTSVTPTEPTTSTQPDPDPFQVLVFHKTAGFQHGSIPAGIEAISELGEEQGFIVTATDDAAVFTEAGLAVYEVIVFLNTTGDILDVGQQQAMEDFIQSGNGFVGIHSATDTEYDWPWYGGLVAAYFEGHPAPQPATNRLNAPDHPAAHGLPASFERFDEWYNFRSPPGPAVVVLATLDETSYQGGTMGDNHPIAWAQDYDGGRAFYTAGGHTIESFAEPLFRAHIAQGILWAAGAG
jgi:cytochrome c